MKIRVSTEFDTDTTNQDIESLRLRLVAEAAFWLGNDPDEAEITPIDPDAVEHMVMEMGDGCVLQSLVFPSKDQAVDHAINMVKDNEPDESDSEIRDRIDRFGHYSQGDYACHVVKINRHNS